MTSDLDLLERWTSMRDANAPAIFPAAKQGVFN